MADIFPDMNRKPPPALESLLAAKGWTATSASEQIGSPDIIRKIYTRKKQALQTDNFLALAALLDVNLEDLARVMGLTGSAGVSPGGPVPGLPLSHAAQAGHFIEEDDSRHEGTALVLPIGPDPRYRARQWLEEIRGDSINKIAPHGSVAQVADWAELGIEPRTDMVVILRRSRAQGALRERSVKVVKRFHDRIEFWPNSTNPKWQEPLIIGPELDSDTDDTASIAGLVIWVHRPLSQPATTPDWP